MTAPVTVTFAADVGVEAGLQWLRTAPPADVYEDRAYVRWLIDELAADGRWADVIEVAHLAELPMAQGGRWGTWKHLLDQALHASRIAERREEEAWALHQLGSRALLRDDLAEARRLLNQALEIRDALPDGAAAAAVTRGNLDILPLAISGLMTGLTLLVGLVALIVPTFDPPEERARRGVLDITDEVVDLGALAGADPVVHMINRGSVELSDVRLVTRVVGTPIPGGDCGDLAPDGGECTVTLDLSGFGVFPLELRARFTVEEGASVDGDETVLVVGG